MGCIFPIVCGLWRQPEGMYPLRSMRFTIHTCCASSYGTGKRKKRCVDTEPLTVTDDRNGQHAPTRWRTHGRQHCLPLRDCRCSCGSHSSVASTNLLSAPRPMDMEAVCTAHAAPRPCSNPTPHLLWDFLWHTLIPIFPHVEYGKDFGDPLFTLPFYAPSELTYCTKFQKIMMC